MLHCSVNFSEKITLDIHSSKDFQVFSASGLEGQSLLFPVKKTCSNWEKTAVENLLFRAIVLPGWQLPDVCSANK